MTTLPAPLPPVLLETLLWQAPVDVLLFDTDLVCRYAAPASGTLFGKTAQELVGRSAHDIFAPEHGDLHSSLDLAAQTAERYDYPSYRYVHAEATEQTHYCWSVRIEAVLLRDYRGQEEFHGVLVTLSDVQDLVDARDQLEAEVADLRRTVARLEEERDAQRDATDEARSRLRESVRNKLTPIVGYLQVVSRYPALMRDRTPADIIEGQVLPGLQRLVESVDEWADSSSREGQQGRP